MVSMLQEGVPISQPHSLGGKLPCQHKECWDDEYVSSFCVVYMLGVSENEGSQYQRGAIV
ncbi:hypothetical protein KSX_90110 [Ktedonospora formicarum]|uniref:Uncharacterized protein n=1 Tax=Ktedonospora formicarum TaxID=2778364 RepID=A0A8J3MYI6_9CHLR|nr:hypothetical protein KSX_90110 [Ktedonospora formicarum]